VVPKGKTVYNYYGGTFGGPIFKNKLFFFGDILRIDDLRGKFDQFTLPTSAFRRSGSDAYQRRTSSTFASDIAYPCSSARRSALARSRSISLKTVIRSIRPSRAVTTAG